jgi:lycopene cyclase domain-containing protein
VVQYNPATIFGLRVFTIPVEDFFYNYAMLSFYLLFYRMRRKSLES